MSTLTVSSELYEEKSYISVAKPIFDETNIVSKFSFSVAPHPFKLDNDGDLIIERRSHTQTNDCEKYVEIEHSKETCIGLVGLQIWRGALLLADWIIHKSDIISNHGKILELGSGVGLSSIIASMYLPVVCTDVRKGGILDLIKCNIKRNKKLTKYPVVVEELDFLQPFNSEIEKILPDVRIILAADVIYDNDITTAFVKTLLKILKDPPNRSVYIALEKRFVFTVKDLDIVAPCYDYFLNELQKLKSIKTTFEEIPLDFPQYFDYHRTKHLVLLKIYSNHC